jgi:hypothetical protein
MSPVPTHGGRERKHEEDSRGSHSRESFVPPTRGVDSLDKSEAEKRKDLNSFHQMPS